MNPTVGILGSGAAGLITAHTLLKDGFNIEILSRDPSPGGVWAKHRVFDGLTVNNVHGEFRFSSLPMPPPSRSKATGGRLTGSDINLYLESFAGRFLKDKFRFNVEVLNVSRNPDQTLGGWIVSIKDKVSGNQEKIHYDKIVLCTGGCSEPLVPTQLATQVHLFQGLVCHSSEFKAYTPKILAVSEPSQDNSRRIVIIGGGKSAQDIATQLTNQGRKVSMVFETTDAFMANPVPLPGFIRKSRFIATLSPHNKLRSRLERFLHTTRLGGFIVRSTWAALTYGGFKALSIPPSSPLTKAHSLFWSIRINDEGVGSPNGFHALANSGAIDLVSPARVTSFCVDGKSVILNNGTSIQADVVIFATGYTSSWQKLFSESTMEEIGLSRHPPSPESLEASKHAWNYTSLKNPPISHKDSDQWCSSIYRGIVPAKNLLRNDFAVNGAIFSTNNGYTWEVVAHWISSYFLNDKFLGLPTSIEQALITTEMNAAWLRKRYPDMLLWANESHSSNFVFFTWPQLCDELMEDMGLKSNRGGGGWLTWPFKVIDSNEIENLTEERRAMRALF